MSKLYGSFWYHLYHFLFSQFIFEFDMIFYLLKSPSFFPILQLIYSLHLLEEILSNFVLSVNYFFKVTPFRIDFFSIQDHPFSFIWITFFAIILHSFSSSWWSVIADLHHILIMLVLLMILSFYPYLIRLALWARRKYLTFHFYFAYFKEALLVLGKRGQSLC